MAIKINLLPPESTVSASAGKLMSLARVLNMFFLVGFLIIGLGLGAFFVFSNLRLNDLSKSNSLLKEQVIVYESSEQQLVLLKDRLAKIERIKGLGDSTKNISNIQQYIASLDSTTLLSELDVDTQKTDISLLFRLNSDLVSFLKIVSENKTYKSSILSSFGYNPSNGYLVSLHLI